MKVVHVFKDYFPPTTGGIEQHVQLLCTGLARHGMDVSVIVPSRSRRGREERLDGVRVIRVPEFGRFAAVPFCPTMPRTLARLRPDIVHLHFPNPMGDIAYLLSTTRLPLVISYHADVVRQRRLLPLYLPILKAVFGRAGKIIASSAEYLASSPVLTRCRDRCTVIPYGIDLAAFSLQDGEADLVEQRRQAHPRGLVLFVGVLRPYKGLDVLLRALAGIRTELIVAGRGPERPRLEMLAARLTLTDRVTFLGEVTESERRILLHACDVFVLPSIDRREAFGIAQLEAMACGKAVIASDLPTGVRFLNRHEETGLLVPPQDPDALAAALQRLLEDPALRARLGAASQQRVDREFSAEQMVGETMRVYEDVSSRK